MEYRVKCALSIFVIVFSVLLGLFFMISSFRDIKREINERNQFKKDFADLKKKVDSMNSVIVSDVTQNTDTKIDNVNVFAKVNSNITLLSENIKTVSDSVTIIKKELDNKTTELKNDIKSTRDDLIKKDIEVDNAIKQVNVLIDSTIVQLNSIKKISDEDRIKVNAVVADLNSVKSKFQELQDQINDIRLMFPDFKFLLNVRKFELQLKDKAEKGLIQKSTEGKK